MNINAIIQCLDNYMIQNGLTHIGAPDANTVLERNGLLRDSGQRPGKPLRDLLRAGKLPHAYQQGRTWIIPISGNTVEPVRSNIQRGPVVFQSAETRDSHNGKIMKFGSIEDLKKAGFKGFMPVWMLKSAGIYISREGIRMFPSMNCCPTGSRTLVSFISARLAESHPRRLCAQGLDNISVLVPESLSDIGADDISGSWTMLTTSCFAGGLPKNRKTQKNLNRNSLQLLRLNTAGSDLSRISRINALFPQFLFQPYSHHGVGNDNLSFLDLYEFLFD